MRHAGREKVYNSIDKTNAPTLAVAPGEAFTAATELCSGPWLKNEDSAKDYDARDRSYTNPSICVAVEGARPGQVLAVDILAVEPEEIGFSGLFRSNPIGGRFFGPLEQDRLKIMRIRGGAVEFSDELRLPVRPMIGLLATAPAGAGMSPEGAARNGGNMDIQEVCAGTTVYLPVEVAGALLHVGDVHALQGDGELPCAGGVECRAKVTLRPRLEPRPKRMQEVRLEDERHIMTAAFGPDTDEAFFAAVEEMLRWLEEGYGLPRGEAFVLLGLVLKARNTQVVNPTRSYLCKVEKKFLPKRL